jgi:hypothetical protein
MAFATTSFPVPLALCANIEDELNLSMDIAAWKTRLEIITNAAKTLQDVFSKCLAQQ